ncbi:hypothetical protein J6590_076238, partial [Homalodisca vitripennis]
PKETIAHIVYGTAMYVRSHCSLFQAKVRSLQPFYLTDTLCKSFFRAKYNYQSPLYRELSVEWKKNLLSPLIKTCLLSTYCALDTSLLYNTNNTFGYGTF